MTCCCPCVYVGLAVAAVAAYFYFSKKCCKKEVKIHKNDWKADTVYLYQFPRLQTIPNMSPYCLKVETFLKANKIPHEVVEDVKKRSKFGMLPFIELNGEQIADSQIIVNRLKDLFKVKPLPSSKDEAIARAFDRMSDNHTLMLSYKSKVLDNPKNDLLSAALRDMMGCPQWLIPYVAPIMGCYMRCKVSKRIAASIGEFPVAECKDFLRKDFDAYRDLLGEKKFLFGDDITATDCTVFSQLATTLYVPTESYAKDILKEEYPTLVAYAERIRDTVFGKDFAKE